MIENGNGSINIIIYCNSTLYKGPNFGINKAISIVFDIGSDIQLNSINFLYFDNNAIINLSKLTSLTSVTINSINEPEIIYPENNLDKLTNLELNKCNLNLIDLSGMVGLEILKIFYNNIESIDLSICKNLKELNVSNCSYLKNLDCSLLTNLSSFGFSDNSNNFITLNLSNTKINTINTYTLPCENLLLNNMLELSNIRIRNTKIENIDLTGSNNIKEIEINNYNNNLILPESFNLVESITLINYYINLNNYQLNNLITFIAENIDCPIKDLSICSNIKMLSFSHINNIEFVNIDNINFVTLTLLNSTFTGNVNIGNIDNAFINFCTGIDTMTINIQNSGTFTNVIGCDVKHLKLNCEKFPLDNYKLELILNKNLKYITINDKVYGTYENDLLNLMDIFGYGKFACILSNLYYNKESELYEKLKNSKWMFPQYVYIDGISYLTYDGVVQCKKLSDFKTNYFNVAEENIDSIDFLSNIFSILDTNNKNITFSNNRYKFPIYIFNMNTTAIQNLRSSLQNTIPTSSFILYTNNSASEFSDILDTNGNPINIDFVDIWKGILPIPNPPIPDQESNKFNIYFITF